MRHFASGRQLLLAAAPATRMTNEPADGRTATRYCRRWPSPGGSRYSYRQRPAPRSTRRRPACRAHAGSGTGAHSRPASSECPKIGFAVRSSGASSQIGPRLSGHATVCAGEYHIREATRMAARSPRGRRTTMRSARLERAARAPPARTRLIVSEYSRALAFKVGRVIASV